MDVIVSKSSDSAYVALKVFCQSYVTRLFEIFVQIYQLTGNVECRSLLLRSLSLSYGRLSRSICNPFRSIIRSIESQNLFI